MVIKDRLNTTCSKCKSGVFIELSVTYTCRVVCSHCHAVFDRFETK